VIGIAAWQSLLDGIGWLVAHIYALIPNYGVTIIVFTILIRLVLLPLGIKQIRSMQHMQAVQPKIKQLQQKYKGNRAKQQEEIMKLYQEYGVSPFSGCWPVLLQFPILIAMYAVLRHPQHPPHLPAGSELRTVINQQIPEPVDPDNIPTKPGPAGGTSFLGMNLLCSASQAGDPNAKLGDRISVHGETKTLEFPVGCGNGVPSRIPYYVFAVLMFGTTFLSQRQMQKASPPGAASGQQQALLKVMPLMFGVFGFFFPAGLVVYWTTSNAWQMGQQYFMLKNRPTAESLAAKAKGGSDRPARKGFLTNMAARAEEERKRRERGGTSRSSGGGKPGNTPRRRGPSGRGRPSESRGVGPAGGDGSEGQSPSAGSADGPAGPGGSGSTGSGGGGRGSRKKRPKR
jgi:YidC/Oxa1 family membrane protein insertase